MPSFDTNVGIHTHADGVIHIHPHSQLGVGANATLGRYMKNARDEGDLEFSLSSTKIEYLGETFEEGETECDGVDDPQVRMAYWSNVQDESVEPEVTRSEERRVGKACVSEGGSRGAPLTEKKKKK